MLRLGQLLGLCFWELTGGDDQVRVEQLPVWSGELPNHGAILLDQDPLEQGLVHPPPDAGWCGAVGSGGVLNELQALFQVLLDRLTGRASFGEPSLAGFDLFGQSVLFGLKQLDRDGPGVVGVQQRAALTLQELQPVGGAGPGLLGLVPVDRQLVTDQLIEQASVFR